MPTTLLLSIPFILELMEMMTNNVHLPTGEREREARFFFFFFPSLGAKRMAITNEQSVSLGVVRVKDICLEKDTAENTRYKGKGGSEGRRRRYHAKGS